MVNLFYISYLLDVWLGFVDWQECAIMEWMEESCKIKILIHHCSLSQIVDCEFIQQLHAQKIHFSGVGAHHQNGISDHTIQMMVIPQAPCGLILARKSQHHQFMAYSSDVCDILVEHYSMSWNQTLPLEVFAKSKQLYCPWHILHMYGVALLMFWTLYCKSGRNYQSGEHAHIMSCL